MAKREWGIGLLRGNLLVLVVCRCIWMFSVSIPMSFLSLYIVELGGSAVTVGLVNSIATLTSLFLYPVGGYIADSRGRVKLVGVATAFFAFSFLPFAYAPDWQTVAIASILQNLVLFYVPVLTAIQADSIPPGQRGLGFALAQAIPGALGIASPYVGGYLIDTLGVLEACRIGFLVSFGAAILVATLRTLKLTETLNQTRESIPLRNVLSLLKTSYSSALETLKWMPKSLRSLAILQVLYIFFHDLAAPFWILYGTHDVIGLSASEWGLLSLAGGALRFTIAIPAGKLIDRYGRRKLLIPMMMLTPLMPLSFVFCRTFWTTLALFLVISIVNAFLVPGFQSLVADDTPRDRRGRVMSVMGTGRFWVNTRGVRIGGGMLLFIPSAAALYLGGYLYTISNVLPFVGMAIGTGLTAVLAIKWLHDPKTLYT